MGSPSLQFLAFSLVTVLVYQLFRSVPWRQFVLLLASGYFLIWFTADARSLWPFVAFLVLGYVGVQLVHSARGAFPIVLVLILLSFFWLKKYAFFPDRAFLAFPYVTVGLSYILFRTLHLVIDTHSGILKQRVGPLSFALYNINFTTLVSGPIQKYPDFIGMLESPACPRPSLLDIGIAVERIIIGFFKTNVLALALSQIHTNALAQVLHRETPFGNLWQPILVFASYPFFLYCNFSGYIDMVIGSARLLSIALPENFNRPFTSQSFIEFWTRWHITLSEWLKTYVYNPLLMNLMRRFPQPRLEPLWAVLSFFVTFFLIGIWHGQTSAFVFFGFLQGLGVSMNKLFQILMTKFLGRKSYRSFSSQGLYVALSRGLTFSWFAFSLIWFWSSWPQANLLFATIGMKDLLAVWLVVWIAAAILLTAWEVLWNAALSVRVGGGALLQSRYWRTAWITALLVIAVGLVMLSNRPAPEMVYKTF
jgi:alginate O-acetyltransferase complex protein AlgI